jgi:phenolic acid decarboxylase
MTSEHQGIIAYYQNDHIDEDSEKGEDGEGYYFVIDDKGLPIGNKLLYCPYCGIEIK